MGTLWDLLERGAARQAVIADRRSAAVTTVELLGRAARAARGLAQWGVRPGERAAVVMPNTTDWFVVHLALARLGILTVPITTRLTAAEITDLLRSSGIDLLVVDPDFLDLGFGTMAGAALEAGLVDRVVTVGGTTVSDGRALAELDGPGPLPPPPDPDTPLVCFGTSGTTGAPKLAVFDHRGVSEHMDAVARALRWGADDVVLGSLPPCGAYGYTVAMAALAAGARLVPLATFTPGELLGEIAEHGATFVAATEAILRAALPPDPAVVELPTWRLAASAGGSLTDLVEGLGHAGVTVVNVYGSSEMLALLALRDPTAPAPGRAVPGGTMLDPRNEVRAVVPDTDEPVATGEVGELQFRGPSLFREYLGNDAATRASRSPDGWHRSGDSGRVDPGGRSFDYLSRLADTLRLKGFLVDPAQIEEVLLAHPDVRGAQVVGVADTSTGEDVAVAFVVGGPATEELRTWCRGRLASFKVPAHVQRIDHIPMTPSANGDKALKRSLRARATTLLEEIR